MKVYIIEGFWVHDDGTWIQEVFLDETRATIERNRLDANEDVDSERLYCVREFEVTP